MRDSRASQETRNKVESSNKDYAHQWLTAHVAVCHSLLSGLLQCLIFAVPYCNDTHKDQGSVTCQDKENMGDVNENEDEGGNEDDEGAQKDRIPPSPTYTDRYILLRAVAETQALLDMLCEVATDLTITPSTPSPRAATQTSAASASSLTETKKQPAASWNVIRSHASMQQAVMLRLNGMAGLGMGLGLGLLSATRPTRRSFVLPMGVNRESTASSGIPPGMVRPPYDTIYPRATAFSFTDNYLC